MNLSVDIRAIFVMYKPKISSQESPFLYLLLLLIAGILSSRYFVLPTGIFLTLLIITGATFKLSKIGTDLCILITFFCLGNIITPKVSSANYQNSPILLKTRCEKVLTGNNYILSVLKNQFHLSNYHVDTIYQVGDSLEFYARILPFRNNSNTHEFSYTQYMQQQSVYYRLQPTSRIQKTGHSVTLHSFFEQQRSRLLEKTAIPSIDSTSTMLMNALCLGYKNDLDSQLRNLFIQTGTIHLLAVSGLHVGIIYLLIIFIFKRLRLYGLKSSLLALPLLWGYALLTGLSPSVTRAALLISFIDISKTMSRDYNPINILAASACLTLVVQPTALYSLSFLLSYSAYCGILIIYPYLFELPGKLPKIPKAIYSYCCLTIAAQLSTIPICAYFFHTININGLLANLIAIPLATILLYCSAIYFVLPLGIGLYITPVCKLLCHALTGFLQWINPYIINIQNLYPSGYSIILLYGTLFTLTGYLLFHKRTFLHATITSLSILLLFFTCNNYHLSHQQEIVIFHYPRHSAILLNHNGFYHPLKTTSDSSTHMYPYIRYNKLKPLSSTFGILNKDIFWQPPYLYYYGDTILFPSPDFPIQHSGNTLIITDNLQPIQTFASYPNLPYPQNIILDGSNNFYTIRQWESFCKKHKLICHNTQEEGEIHLRRN